MKKLTALFMVGILCVFTATAQTVVELDTAIQQACKELYTRFLVWPLAILNCAAPTDAASAYVLKEMAIELGKTGGTIVSRADTDRALAAFNIKSNADINDASAIQIGRRLGAQIMVTAVMEKTGETYRLRTRLISTATGKMELSTTANVKDSALVQQLIPPPKKAEVTPAPAQTPAPVTAQASAPAPAQAETVYKIGDKGPAGGFIFYDKGNNKDGWRYLEAAPADINRLLKGATESFDSTNLKERGVGWGKRNTDEIMKQAANKGGGFGWAAQACSVYTLNGFNDWFLPSRDELHYMYGNLHMQGLGNFRNDWYGSSTAAYDESWMAENFEKGNQDNFGNYREYRVRPIRQF